MSRPRKYRMGPPMKDFELFGDLLLAGAWFYIGADATRPTHPAWLGNLPYFRLRHMVKGGRIFKAIRNPNC